MAGKSTEQIITFIRTNITDPLLRQNTAKRHKAVLEQMAVDYFNKQTDMLAINQVTGLQDALDQFGVGFNAIDIDASLIPDIELLSQNQANAWLFNYLRELAAKIKTPDAPTEALVDDVSNTFSAKLVPGFPALANYQAFTPTFPAPFLLSAATGYIQNGRVYVKNIVGPAGIGQVGLSVAASGSRPASMFVLNTEAFSGTATPPDDPSTGGSVAFNGNRPIKTLPQIGVTYGGETITEFEENMYFGFISAVVTLGGGGNFELGTTANVTIQGSYTANDEKKALTGVKLLKNDVAVAGINSLPINSAQSLTADTTFVVEATADNGGKPKVLSATTKVGFIKPLLFGGLPLNPSAAQVKGLAGRILGGAGEYTMMIDAASNRMTISIPANLNLISVKDPDNGQIVQSFSPINQNLPFDGYPDQGYKTFQNNADFSASAYKLTVIIG
jgi:hypothetical protein